MELPNPFRYKKGGIIVEQNKLENLLVAISEKLEHMETKINNMENEFSPQLKALTADMSSMKVTLENETNKKLQMLAEGFQAVPELSEEVHSLSKDMEVVKFDVDIVKKVVTTHSTELNKLGRAK